MVEDMGFRSALILGAACPIGTALMKHSAFKRYRKVILADGAPKQYIVRAIAKRLGRSLSNTTILPLWPEKPFAGLDTALGLLDSIGDIDIFNLSHSRDRKRSSTEIRDHNDLMFERSVSIAYKLTQLHSIAMVTDIGLVGDYPGRFSENWIEVGQTPFDEVDRSSIAIELACLKEPTLPIKRVRVGLVLDPEGFPSSFGYWPPASEIFVGFSNILRRLPHMVTIPVAAAKGGRIPITPADLAAEVLLCAVEDSSTSESAIHAVTEPSPTVDMVLSLVARRIGGARMRSGLPIDKVAKLGLIPGFKELARRNADQLASWWTPHRYCLSVNDVDTSRLHRVLSEDYRFPPLAALEHTF
jgi:hypothetical protein